MIDRGESGDQAEAARRLRVTRARMTQILNLALLAPDLQEKVLLLESLDGRAPLSERALRVALRIESWKRHRETLQDLRLIRPVFARH